MEKPSALPIVHFGASFGWRQNVTLVRGRWRDSSQDKDDLQEGDAISAEYCMMKWNSSSINSKMEHANLHRPKINFSRISQKILRRQ